MFTFLGVAPSIKHILSDCFVQWMEATQTFLYRRFQNYYQRAPLICPKRFTRREWGFMFFAGGFMRRHIAFRTREDIHAFLAREVPAHAYFSSAYYEQPGAATMNEKGWLGADLIFDLDADHLSGAEGLSYEKMLELVKKEIIRLLDDFLRTDFGFEEDALELFFSGGRGYHVHVHDPKVLELSSHERREIVDYVLGTGLDFTIIFPSHAYDKIEYGPRTTVKSRFDPLLDNEAAGWQGRLRRGIEMLLQEWETAGEHETVKKLTARKGIGKIGAEKLYQELFEGKPGKRKCDRIIAEGVLEVFTTDRLRDLFLRTIKEEVSVSVAGETDEPVTSDIKRLIRLPGSLHGKTGLRVVPVPLDKIETFDPLIEAIAFSDVPVPVTIVRPFHITLCNEQFELEPDTKSQNLPEYAAIFALARGFAKL